MEWTELAIVLGVRPFGEGDAVASVLTGTHGHHRGLARGALSRGKAAAWQPGNLLQARWVARLGDQLGSMTGELVHPTAALAMAEPLGLAALGAACAVAEGALPEREPHGAAFSGLAALLRDFPAGLAVIPGLVRWEAVLLAELGYGLDLSRCAMGGADEPAFVSPRTGRAVSRAAAGVWESRLLRLPAFLLGAGGAVGGADCRDGLRLTGHFLARDVFGADHKPLPAARRALADRVADLAAAMPKEG